MYQQNRDLLDAINERKSKLYDTAKKKGLASEETIKHSQELDQLIFQYQRKVHKKSKRVEENQTVFQQVMSIMPAYFAEI